MALRESAVVLLALALTAVLVPAATAAVSTPKGCPAGEIWSTKWIDCVPCDFGLVKVPQNRDDQPTGLATAVCKPARQICGTSEYADFGICTPCDDGKVRKDGSDTICLSCPVGTERVGGVSDGTCQPVCVPSKEVCDGVDNDCDGEVDNNIPDITCGKGACTVTVPACAADGTDNVCTPLDPKKEACNLIDDNCDGIVDNLEQPTISCGFGVCTNTVKSCIAGKVPACKPVASKAGVEVCNGLDDNCNGKIDENLGTVTCGLGECKNTVPKCDASAKPFPKLAKCEPLPQQPEVCDGKDNNCNGKVDEGLGQTTCFPCNTVIDNCAKGVSQNCEGVCANPCCQDCATYTSSAKKAVCFKNCVDCVDKKLCLDWADDIADVIGDQACEFAIKKCEVLLKVDCSLTPAGCPNIVTRKQCYAKAGQQCLSRAEFYISSEDGMAGSCRYYNILDGEGDAPARGTCTYEEFQAYVLDFIGAQCMDASKGIAINVFADN